MKIDVEKKSIREGIKLYEINRIYKKKYRFNLKIQESESKI